jgi:hypothetical protein
MFFWRREEAKHFAFDLEIGNCHEALASLMVFPRQSLVKKGSQYAHYFGEIQNYGYGCPHSSSSSIQLFIKIN